MKDGSIRGARKYLDKLCGSKETSDVDYNIYKMLDTVLDFIQNQEHILNTKHPESIVEGHFKYSIWLPFLQKLCSINNNKITLKPAESISDESTIEKERVYGDNHASLKGFKVDIRFLYTFCGLEFDLCCLKTSLSKATDEKAQNDQSKLIREGRTSTTSLFHATNNCTHSWTIQVSGATASFCTIEYVGKNLFVAKPQFNVVLSSSIGQLEEFIVDLEKLLSFQHDMEFIAHSLEAMMLKKKANNDNKATKKHQSRTPSPPPHHLKAPSTVNWLTPPRVDNTYSVIHHMNKQLLRDASDFEIDDSGGEEELGKNIDYASSSSEDDFVKLKFGCCVMQSYRLSSKLLLDVLYAI